MVVTLGVNTGVAGTGLSDTTVEAVIVQVPLVALNTYVPAVVEVTGVITGVNEVDVNPAGPVQDQLVPVVEPVNVTLPPGHTAPLLVADTNTGHGAQRYTWLAAGNVKVP